MMLELTQLRMGLLAAGYTPLPANGKRVLVPGWNTLHVDDKEIQSWEYRTAWTNTGLRTRYMPTLDVDINDSAAVNAVVALVQSHYGDRGKILVRTGNAPRCAILFRTDTPFFKCNVHLQLDAGEPGKLEMLSDGQQVIAFGVHPQTKRPYQWDGGQPGEIPYSALPPITLDEMRELLINASMLLQTQFGYRWAADTALAPTQPHAMHCIPTADVPAPNEASAEDVELVVGYLNAISPDLSYPRWFALGCALYGILGDATGKRVWQTWSRGGTKYRAGEIDTKWRGIVSKQGYRRKWKTLLNEWALASNARMTDEERAELEQSVANILARGTGK